MREQKLTQRGRFLTEMNRAVPWLRLMALVKPFYLPEKRCRPPLGMELILRVCFLQQWYALADEVLEDAIHESRAMRAFVGGDPGLDAMTLSKFHHML